MDEGHQSTAAYFAEAGEQKTGKGKRAREGRDLACELVPHPYEVIVPTQSDASMKI